jgi:hypothetical protein
LDDILGFDRLLCTGDRARGGWYFDQDRIREVLDELDIRLNVQLKFMTGIYRYGTHRIKGGLSNPYHHVTVDQTDSAFDANKTIWHELTHCKQSEEWQRRTGLHINSWHSLDYKAVDGEHGRRYKGNLYEIEARQAEADNENNYLVIFAP